MRFRAIVAVTVIAFTASVAACEQDTPDLGDHTVNIGLGTEAPGFASGEPPVGFDITFKDFVLLDMEQQYADAGARFTVGLQQRLTAPERESLLVQGKVTLVFATFSISEARNAMGIDYAGPYMKSPQAFLVRDIGAFTIDERGELAGRTVCRVKGTTNAGVPLPAELRETTLADSTKLCVDLLLAGSVDLVFSDAVILYGFAGSNPGLKVTLPGAYGSTQLYGIGLQGERRDECLKLNNAIRRYLNKQWRADFGTYLPAAVADHPDFESLFKPVENDFKVSCKETVRAPKAPGS